MSVVTSRSQFNSPSSLPPVGLEAQGKELEALSDSEFQTAVEQMSNEFLSPRSYEREEWLKYIPYKRILQVCDAEKARLILCWMTAADMLSNFRPTDHPDEALKVMNEPSRLPVFLEVLKQSRGKQWDGLHVKTLLYSDDNNALNNHYRGWLPANILQMLEIEYSIARFENQHSAIFAEHKKFIEQRDKSLIAFVQEATVDKTPIRCDLPDSQATIADLAQKV